MCVQGPACFYGYEKNRRTESLPYGVRRYFSNRSLCVPVWDKVSTSASSSMIDQQSIREDITLAVPDPVPGQRVIRVFSGSVLPIARTAITSSGSSIFKLRFMASLKSFLNCMVGLTGCFIFLMLSDLQRVHPDCYTLSRMDLLQSFLPPTWRQSFPCWAD